MGTVLDIAIGLAFVFALVALICTGLQEWVSGMMNLRGKTLWEGIQSMLLADAAKATDPGQALDTALAKHPLVKGSVPDRFYALGLFKWFIGIREPSADIGSTKPSYLDASVFATALADSIGAQWKGGSRRYDDFGLAVAAMPEGELKTLLLKMVDETRSDPIRLRTAVEAWYDETMKRVSGWYKRRVQALLVFIGLIVAIGLNIDAIYIANSMATHTELRKALADQAVKAAEANQVSQAAAPTGPAAAASGSLDAAFAAEAQRAKKQAQDAQKQLQNLNLPIGWDGAGRPVNDFSDWLLRALGWGLTALAASFGAPFWFQLIGRLAPLRAAGSKPATKSDDAAAAATKPAAAAAPGTATNATAPGAAQADAPFRFALNDYEAQGISEAELIRVKRMLGVTGTNATNPLLDQATRDAIQLRQKAKGLPETGELSAVWVQALFAGTA